MSSNLYDGVDIQVLKARVDKVFQRSVTGVNAQLYNFQLGDIEKHLQFFGTVANSAYSIVNDATISWPDGAQLFISQYGTTPVAIAAGAGVNLYAPNGAPVVTTGPWTSLLATRIGANSWQVQQIGIPTASASFPGLVTPGEKARIDAIYVRSLQGLSNAYTVQLIDRERILSTSGSANINVTINEDASMALGSVLYLVQGTALATGTFVAGTGTTFSTQITATTTGLQSTLKATKTAPGVWIIQLDVPVLATTTSPGLMSAADKVALAAASTNAGGFAQPQAVATHVYLAGSGAQNPGNDANNGLSWATAKASLAGIWSLLPAIQRGPFVIHMDKINATWVNPPPNIQLNANCFILFVGDGPVGTITASFTIAAGSTPTVLKTTGLTADQYTGWSVLVNSGPAATARRMIAGNTATDLRLTAPMMNAAGSPVSVAAGETVMGFRNVCWISFPAPTTGDATVTIDARCHFFQCTFSPVGTTQVNVKTSGVLYGVELLAYVTLVSAGAQAGTCDAEFLASLLTAQSGTPPVTKPQWEGWGLGRTIQVSGGAGNCLDVANASSFLGYIATRTPVTISGTGAICRILGGLMDSILAAGRNCEITLGMTYFNGAFAHAIATAGDCEIECNDDVVVNTAAATAFYGVSIEGKARMRCEGALTIYGFSTGAALRVVGCGAVAVNGALSIAQYASANPIFVSQCGQLSVGGGVFLTNTGTQHVVHCLGSSITHFSQTLVVNSTNAASCAFFAGENARLTMGTASLSAVNGAAVQDCAAVTCSGSFSLTNVSGVGLGVIGAGASLQCKDVVAISNNGSSTLYVDKGARVSFSSSSASKVLTNTASGAGAVGIRCLGGGQFECGSNINTNMNTSFQNYGCDVRGGGRAYFAVQPTNVVGSLADFIVGQAPGDAYPDTALNAVYNSISAGGSLVQRSG